MKTNQDIFVSHGQLYFGTAVILYWHFTFVDHEAMYWDDS